MSHTTSIKAIKITNIAALEAAVAELRQTGVACSLIPNAKPRAYYTNQQGMGVADFVLKLDAAKYDVGFYKQADGSYEPRTDFFMKSVENVLGAAPRAPENAEQARLGKLFQMYGIHAATQEARRRGHVVRRVTKQDGTVALEVTGNF